MLSFDNDPVTRRPTVEVAHEALLYEWRRLREWLDESRADIRTQRVLANAAHEWRLAECDPGYLLSGSRLDQFEAWALVTGIALTVDERTFLEASLEERRKREEEEVERQAHEVCPGTTIAQLPARPGGSAGCGCNRGGGPFSGGL